MNKREQIKRAIKPIVEEVMIESKTSADLFWSLKTLSKEIGKTGSKEAKSDFKKVENQIEKLLMNFSEKYPELEI